jgi:hypothetical protein
MLSDCILVLLVVEFRKANGYPVIPEKTTVVGPWLTKAGLAEVGSNTLELLVLAVTRMVD